MGFPDAKWAVDQIASKVDDIVSKLGVHPNDMRSFLATPLTETSIGLKFLEPADLYYSEGGVIAAETKGVIIRMSTEDYPQNINDGDLVVDNTNLGAYENSYYEVEDLVEGQEYYFSAFPYSSIGLYNESLSEANKAMEIPRAAENVKVTITIDDTLRFSSTTVTLVDITESSQVSRQLSAAGVVEFNVNTGDSYKVTVSSVEGYKLDSSESQVFVATTGGSKELTFAFEMGFLYAIKFDNGADGFPSSFEYLEDCAGFTPASVDMMNSWRWSRILNKFKPCLIKPGATAPEYYLDKNNYKFKESGSASVLTGADGDVMVEVEQMWYKVVKNTTDSTATLYVSEVPLTGYKSFIGNQSVAYRGVYEASFSDNVLRSVSGVAPLVSKTRAQFRLYASARGNEYSQNDYYLLRLWQCMYLLLYGTRDSQTALGKGCSALSSTAAPIITGTMNDKPFCWGDDTGTSGVKFLGVENFYGNLFEFVDGLTIVSYVCKITEDSSKYDDVGTSYEVTAGAVPSSLGVNYIKEMQATDDAPFLPSKIGGSEITYFADSLQSYSNTRAAAFGGGKNDGSRCGAFCWNFYNVASSTSQEFGSRLCRKKVS